MLVLDIGILHSGHRILAVVRFPVGDDIVVVRHSIALCTTIGEATRFTRRLTKVLRKGLQNMHKWKLDILSS